MPRRHRPARHSVVLCRCPRNALCDACRANLYQQLCGVAMRRGDYWAERVAAIAPEHRRKAWPADGATYEIALRKVADLTDDEALRGMLAAACAEQAAKWWGQFAVTV